MTEFFRVPEDTTQEYKAETEKGNRYLLVLKKYFPPAAMFNGYA